MNGIGKTSRSRLETLMLSKPTVIKPGEWEKVESKAMERSQHSMADSTSGKGIATTTCEWVSRDKFYLFG